MPDCEEEAIALLNKAKLCSDASKKVSIIISFNLPA